MSSRQPNSWRRTARSSVRPAAAATCSMVGSPPGNEATLVVDARDGLLAAQVARDRAVEEEPDDLAVPRADLLTDDHTEAVLELPQSERAIDGVVIGRADHVDARGPNCPCLLGDRRAAVRRGLGVRVHVHANTLRLSFYQAARPVGVASATRHGLKADGFARLGGAWPR